MKDDGKGLPPARKSKPGSWMRVALVISLAINLAVLGMVAGAFLKAGGPTGHRFAVRDLGFGPFSEALSDEDRQALRKAFSDRAPDFRERRLRIREDVAAILAALREEPFDPTVLTAALERGAARAAERQDVGQALILERVGQMSSAERQSFADRLEAGLSRRRDRRD